MPWPCFCNSGKGERFSVGIYTDKTASVPVPLPIIVVNIQGPFTEKDRKLWAFLVHAVWNELETNRFHELSVRKINQVFRACGGDHSTNWIWDSVKRLVRTTVEWEDINGDERYQGLPQKRLNCCFTDWSSSFNFFHLLRRM